MQGLPGAGAVGWRGVCWGRGRGCRPGAGWVQAGRRLGAGWVQQARCRLGAGRWQAGAGWVQAGHLRGASPPTPALEEALLDVVVAEHVEQPQLAGLLVELAEAALRLAPQD